VISGEAQAPIEGVQVEPHELSPRDTAREGWIAFDTWLYAISPVYGTTVWDLDAQHCLHHDPEFTPRFYHPLTQCFISLEGGTAKLSRIVT